MKSTSIFLIDVLISLIDKVSCPTTEDDKARWKSGAAERKQMFSHKTAQVAGTGIETWSMEAGDAGEQYRKIKGRCHWQLSVIAPGAADVVEEKVVGGAVYGHAQRRPVADDQREHTNPDRDQRHLRFGEWVQHLQAPVLAAPITNDIWFIIKDSRK